MNAEILAPAGSYDGLRAAVNAGANAVYIGGTRFGARAFADNLTTEQLLAAIDYCHLHGRKLYLTVNTLLKNTELDDLYDYLLPFYRHGLDAVIVQDMGVFDYIHHSFPGLDIHASTQMTITATDGARFLKSRGATRIVTSRELSLDEIRKIHESADIEIESFVHGALCYSYSGQCLYSSLIGGRSGNRGRCAQPCRLPYETEGVKGYLLSPKDICTLEILPDILEAGVYSLKIEGRMKRAEYAAGVVKIYRKYLDYYLEHGRSGYLVDAEDKRQLMELYNRGGFTSGYYRTRNGRKMISMLRQNHFGTEAAKVISADRKQIQLQALLELHKGDVIEKDILSADVKTGKRFRMPAGEFRRPKPGEILHRTRDEQLIAYLQETYVKNEIKEKINGKLIINAGKPAILMIKWKSLEISVTGQVPKEAQNQPLTREKAKKQIAKMGNTPFIFTQLESEIEDGLFLPLQSLNELRRAAVEKLEQVILDDYKRDTLTTRFDHQTSEAPQESAEHHLYAAIENIELFDVLNEIPGLDGIYLDSTSLPFPLSKSAAENYAEKCRGKNKTCCYIMPAIFREDAKQLGKIFDTLSAFDGIVVKNYESWQYLLDHDWKKKIILDHNMYTFNESAKYFSKQNGITHDTAPVELTERELQKRGCQNSELIVYGRLPMMVTAQCLYKTIKKCRKKPEILWMKDRMGKRFPVKNNCNLCYNVIYNQVPVSFLDNKKEIDKLAPKRLRLVFTTEKTDEAAALAAAFVNRFKLGNERKYDFGEFTRGHFKRGIE